MKGIPVTWRVARPQTWTYNNNLHNRISFGPSHLARCLVPCLLCSNAFVAMSTPDSDIIRRLERRAAYPFYKKRSRTLIADLIKNIGTDVLPLQSLV